MSKPETFREWAIRIMGEMLYMQKAANKRIAKLEKELRYERAKAASKNS